MLLLSN